jgi:PBSX family phage terminase large subunit
MRTIKLQVTVPQQKFLSLRCKHPAFIAGYGAGKTETLATRAMLDAAVGPDVLVAIYAPTHTILRDGIIPRLLERLDNFGIKYDYHRTYHTVTTESDQFGNFMFVSLDNPENIVSFESFAAHVDEIDILPLDHAVKAWRKILGRNRQVPANAKGLINRASIYTTPEGYNFAYKYWSEEDNPNYQMVQAASWTNPFLPISYLDTLYDSYPAKYISAYIEGKFVNLKSGTVYNEYDRKQHLSEAKYCQGEIVHIGCDFNLTKQAASVFVKRGDSYHAVDELVNMYDTYEMINIIKDKYKGSKVIIYPDASGQARKGRSSAGVSTSEITMLQEAGFEVRVNKANPRVKDRIIATNNAFNKGQIYINSRLCPTIAKSLEQQCYDSKGEPDKSSGVDHQNDATTYFISYVFPVRKPIANIPISFLN